MNSSFLNSPSNRGQFQGTDAQQPTESAFEITNSQMGDLRDRFSAHFYELNHYKRVFNLAYDQTAKFIR
ncbi:MAG: hypothetical protein KDD62_16530, partial [Bdellovibrionales bacterium]|nr:hypothetical protein [Bdellovibrionales bacterium]